MPPVALILIAIIIALPVFWLVAEFRANRARRITLGLVALGVTGACLWAFSTVTNRFNYNAWYGAATHRLLTTSLSQIENGHVDRVIAVWRTLSDDYKPTYENRANYDRRVQEAVDRMRAEQGDENEATIASTYNADTWLGHCEDESGYWIVIDDAIKPFAIVQSSENRAKLHAVSISPDFRVLQFTEGNKWRHTITLTNDYEGIHEWYDLDAKTVWQTRPVFKLIRASDKTRMKTTASVEPTQRNPVKE